MRVLKSGRITFNGGYAAYDCRVKNLSAGGALLQMPSLLGIPSRFDIEIDKSGNRRLCTVMWRNDTQMGVAFDDAPPAAAASDGPRLRLVEPAGAAEAADQTNPVRPVLKSA